MYRHLFAFALLLAIQSSTALAQIIIGPGPTLQVTYGPTVNYSCVDSASPTGPVLQGSVRFQSFGGANYTANKLLGTLGDNSLVLMASALKTSKGYQLCTIGLDRVDASGDAAAAFSVSDSRSSCLIPIARGLKIKGITFGRPNFNELLNCTFSF